MLFALPDRLLEASKSYQELKQLVGKNSVLIPMRNGKRQRMEIDSKYVNYLLQPDEVFARAYAQYVAVRSGAPELLAYPSNLRIRGQAICYWKQWGDDDFVPVASAIDEMIEELGWIKRMTT
jgi:hypothetical protein